MQTVYTYTLLLWHLQRSGENGTSGKLGGWSRDSQSSFIFFVYRTQSDILVVARSSIRPHINALHFVYIIMGV